MGFGMVGTKWGEVWGAQMADRILRSYRPPGPIKRAMVGLALC